jgi:hypothetical protein
MQESCETGQRSQALGSFEGSGRRGNETHGVLRGEMPRHPPVPQDLVTHTLKSSSSNRQPADVCCNMLGTTMSQTVRGKYSWPVFGSAIRRALGISFARARACS